MKDFDPLFQPLRIRNTEVANRFAMPAMQVGNVDERTPNEDMARHLRSRAEGGVGLIITESVFPDHPSSYWSPMGCVLTPGSRDMWARAVGGVKDADGVILMQLMHPGAVRVAPKGAPFEDFPSLSPSGLAAPGRSNGRAMTADDLREIKDAFVRAALMAFDVGADGVEVHCAHGYLMDQFLWAGTNLRQDGYGGRRLAERARYPAEIVAAIRAALPQNFIISVKFSQWKELDYNARIAEDPEDLAAFLARMRAAGADLFDVSGRRYNMPAWPEAHPTRSLAAWVKTMTDAPVMALGSVGLKSDVNEDLFDGIPSPLQIMSDLEGVRKAMLAGDFDLIGVGRLLLANSHLVASIKAGDMSKIVPFEKKVHLARLLAKMGDMGAIQRNPH